MSARNHRQAGFTLVEAMVALVVLSVGMLGIAGLYVTTLRSGGGSIYRMQAVNLASDLADRIRANRTANLAYLAAPLDNGCYGALAVAVICTPQQMAATDLAVWQTQVANVLPAGTGLITSVVPVAGSTTMYTYTINVSWTESSGTPSYTLTLQI